jgi:hypothetical protein
MKQQALRHAELSAELLNFRLRGIGPDRRRRDAKKTAILIGSDEAAFVVRRQGNP